jgi:hypothetical protein
MELAVGVALGLIAVSFFSLYQFSQRKRNHILGYAVYLLLSDEIRERNKQDFLIWLRRQEANGPHQLWFKSTFAIEKMSDDLARGDEATGKGSSVLGAPAMLWAARRNIDAG